MTLRNDWYTPQPTMGASMTNNQKPSYPTEQDMTRLQDRVAVLEQQLQSLHHMLEPAFGLIATQVRTVQQHLAHGNPSQANVTINELAAMVQHTQNTYREHMINASSTSTAPSLEFSPSNSTLFLSLQRYARRLSELSSTPTRVDVPLKLHNQRFPSMIEMHLLWIIQETLRSLYAYAQATATRISFDIINRELLVTILIDRQLHTTVTEISVGEKHAGAPSQTSTACRQLGTILHNIRARVRSIGGTFDLENRSGSATSICITAPLRRQNDLRPHTMRILLASHDEAFGQRLQAHFDTCGFEVVGTIRDGLKMMETVQVLHPDIVLLDMHLPHGNGLQAITMLKAAFPHIQVVILTDTIDEQNLYEALKNGAAGYLPRNLAEHELLDMLVDVQAGELALSTDMARKVLKEFTRQVQQYDGTSTARSSASHDLSPRQIEVLTLVSQDYTYKAVGDQLGFSERTIKHYMSGIIKQLQLKNRSEAVAYARQNLNADLDSSSDT